MSGPGEFGRQAHTRGRGRVAEEAAAAWLKTRGYRRLERNVETAAGEIDLVALDGDTLCFVEIKARSSGAFGPTLAAVGRSKQRRLARCAALYLAANPWEGPCRFDVLAMDGTDEGWRYSLVKDAFEAG